MDITVRRSRGKTSCGIRWLDVCLDGWHTIDTARSLRVNHSRFIVNDVSARDKSEFSKEPAVIRAA
jgi:hypothetical protein